MKYNEKFYIQQINTLLEKHHFIFNDGNLNTNVSEMPTISKIKQKTEKKEPIKRLHKVSFFITFFLSAEKGSTRIGRKPRVLLIKKFPQMYLIYTVGKNIIQNASSMLCFLYTVPIDTLGLDTIF